MPDQLWSLTWNEFHIKHDAFVRGRDWQRSLIYEYVLQNIPKDKPEGQKVQRQINALRRYPIKPWVPQP